MSKLLGACHGIYVKCLQCHPTSVLQYHRRGPGAMSSGRRATCLDSCPRNKPRVVFEAFRHFNQYYRVIKLQK
jgi:hypothetical protein